jgi:hypothetical protein
MSLVCYVDKCTLFGCRMFWDQVVAFVQVGRQAIMPSFFVVVATYMKVAFFPAPSYVLVCYGIYILHFCKLLGIFVSFCLSVSDAIYIGL